MPKRQFHLSDVLSITTELIVSSRQMKGVHDILKFMTGDNELSTHQLSRALDECKPYLLEQHPQLGTPEMDEAVAVLSGKLDAVEGNEDKEECERVVHDWIAIQVEKYGEMLDVMPIPIGAHEVRDSLEELMEKTGGSDGVIIVID